MDYFNSFAISVSGMEVQKVKLDTVALNLANVNTTRSIEGGPYKPLVAIIAEKAGIAPFDKVLESARSQLGGAEVAGIEAMNAEPRLVFEPEHPDANEKGFVAYPSIDPVSEMVKMMEATRAYEANVKAVNAAKTMALRALQIGEK